jgi:3-dehydroquinate synthetase
MELQALARLGHTPRDLVDRTRTLLRRMGLPVEVPPAEMAAAWPFVAADKKRTRGSIRLPVVTAPGAAQVQSVPLSQLQSAALRTD